MPAPQKVTIDDSLQIDCSPEQDYSGPVETTDHPIEDGANPTDHAREKPETFTATFILSSVPVEDGERQSRGPFDRYATGGYARDTYEKLRQMKSDRQLHSLKTPLRSYENMILADLSSPTRASYGDGVVCKVLFKEIRVVNSGTAQLARAPVTNTQKPTTKQNQAKKQSTPAEKDVSAIKNLTNGTGVTKEGSGIVR